MGSIIIDCVFLFVYLFVLLYFLFPDMITNNYPIYKLYLFLLISVFVIVTQTIYYVKYNSDKQYKLVWYNGIKYGLVGLASYGLYLDLQTIDLPIINKFKILSISGIITMGITCMWIIDNIFLID